MLQTTWTASLIAYVSIKYAVRGGCSEQSS